MGGSCAQNIAVWTRFRCTLWCHIGHDPGLYDIVELKNFVVIESIVAFFFPTRYGSMLVIKGRFAEGCWGAGVVAASLLRLS